MRCLKGSLVLAVIVLISGCSLLGSEGSEEPTQLTKQLRRAGAEVPNYGGVTIDRKSEQITIYVLGSEKKEEARSVVQEIFGERASEIALNVRPAIGEASKQMKSKATGITTVEGVHMLDYDETINYLRIRATSASVVKAAQKKIKELDVPLDQVIIRLDGGVVLD
jgi:hypothetical protein